MVCLRRARRAFLALVAVFVVLLQPWVGTSHAVAMTLGMEVCTTAGIQSIDAQGKALDDVKHDVHDCCSSGAAGLPADVATTGHGQYRHAAPAEMLTAGRLDAEWLSPLSRGPPSALRS
jgi:hypothetical protein